MRNECGRQKLWWTAGIASGQQNFNQLQFCNRVQANSNMGQYNQQNQSGDKTIPTKIHDPPMG